MLGVGKVGRAFRPSKMSVDEMKFFETIKLRKRSESSAQCAALTKSGLCDDIAAGLSAAPATLTWRLRSGIEPGKGDLRRHHVSAGSQA